MLKQITEETFLLQQRKGAVGLMNDVFAASKVERILQKCEELKEKIASFPSPQSLEVFIPWLEDVLNYNEIAFVTFMKDKSLCNPASKNLSDNKQPAKKASNDPNKKHVKINGNIVSMYPDGFYYYVGSKKVYYHFENGKIHLVDCLKRLQQTKTSLVLRHSFMSVPQTTNHFIFSFFISEGENVLAEGSCYFGFKHDIN